MSGLCDGFDRSSGAKWIYPNNLPIRGYQKLAVEKSLFNNSMIVLPTGFGKTFIAAVVMYNYFRWYPMGKIIFVAPTRPLVAQQIQECKKISGIPSSSCVELTGSTVSIRRVSLWDTKRVFFATPQVIDNDLDSGILPATQVRLIVIDEAHRAQGGFAYVNIIQSLHAANKNGFRVVALSATPGSDMQRVQQVITNLLINDVMFRTENSFDLSSYKNVKTSKAFTVDLDPKHAKIVKLFSKLSDPVFKELFRAGLTYRGDSIDTVAKYTILQASQKVRNNEARGQKGRLSYMCCLATSLKHSFELLTIYGIRVFNTHIQRIFVEKSGGAIKSFLAGKAEYDVIKTDIEQMFGKYSEPNMEVQPPSDIDLTAGHTKLKALKEILLKHFQKSESTNTRAMVFTKFKDSVFDIVQTLKAFDPILKPGPFIGQGKTSGACIGMSQKEQLDMIAKYRGGEYNVLVATCVAEEGLDIGECDLCICYDTSSSPISNTQRRGRTGRKRAGDVTTLLTKGFEEKKLSKAGQSRRTVEDQLYKKENYENVRYRESPRMVPHDIKPECLEMKISPTNDDLESEPAPKRRRRKNDEEAPSFCKKKKECIEEDPKIIEPDSDTDIETPSQLNNNSPNTSTGLLDISALGVDDDEIQWSEL